MLELTEKMILDIPPTIPPVCWKEARADYVRGPIMFNPENTVEYFKKYIGGKETEAFLIMFLDHQNHILDVVLHSEGTADHSAVYPREIFKKALELNATGLILAHNHPAGSLTPSEADKALTRQINTASKALGMSLFDHLIVTHEGFFSFKQAGLMF